MTFISVGFWIFCAVTMIIYFCFPEKYKWVVLLAASLGFYAVSGPDMLLILLLSSLIAYGFARWMVHVYKNEE